jgi:hypothetical protein
MLINGSRSRFKTVCRKGDSPIFPRGLGKIGTVPDGFETASTYFREQLGGVAVLPDAVQISQSYGAVGNERAITEFISYGRGIARVNYLRRDTDAPRVRLPALAGTYRPSCILRT